MRRMIIPLALIIVMLAAFLPAPVHSAQAATIPTFSIVSVVTDTSVTIKTANFPKNIDFKVTMGKFGTMGVGGTEVATSNSGDGGALSFTYNIPDGLKGLDIIAIRLQATSGGYYAYNWFWNNTAPAASTPAPGATQPPSTNYPVFSIVNVEKDAKVTIKTANFPKNVDFKVRMGKYGTKGIGGVEVATSNSGEGGALSFTYDIPESLKGLDRIAIRMDATSGGYYAFNWFWNNTASAASTPAPGATPIPGYVGYPTFVITAVAKDSTVTIKTNNLPKGVDFKVLMGKYGTQGIAGTEVAVTNSGDGGSQTFTYNIPDGLKGLDRIAIRLQATSGGYYAFNWFWNNDHP